MTRDVKYVLDAALALPTKKRAEIAERLLRSLDGPQPSAAEQKRIDAAWEREIARRLKEIDDGTAELIPFETVMADARATLRRVNRNRKR